MKKIYLLALVLCGCLSGYAITVKDVRTSDVVVKKIGPNLRINFVVDVPEHMAGRNYKLVMTPVLINEPNMMMLDPIVVETRRTRIIDQRNDRFAVMDTPFVIQGYGNMAYEAIVPYEKWMDGSVLRLDKLLSGCCSEYFSTVPLTDRLRFAVPVYRPKPYFSYVNPDVELTKRRNESGTAYVEFPQGQSVLLTEYRNNSAELSKISKSIELVRDETGIKMTGIDLIGTCSPEATWAFNARLAQNRANVVKSYIMKHYKIAGDLIKVSSIPEDWADFKRLVEASDMADKSKVLDIINSDAEPDRKDWLLSQMSVYGYLMKNIYPKLRKVDYTINYTVRGFDLEESKQILNTAPKNLSLSEMYAIAESYPEGSSEANRVYEIAAKEFPEDAVANTNAAITAYNQGNIEQAKRYLDSVKSSNLPQYNNMVGVVAMAQGDYEKAAIYLNKADDDGSDEAQMNLEELKKKLANVEAIKEYEQ